MARHDEVGKHATTISTVDGTTHVTYHQTAVVSFNAQRITLRTGGWRTATTKTRMNQTANQFGLGFGVYQKNHEWYVTIDGEDHEFDGDTFVFDRQTRQPITGMEKACPGW